MGEIAKTCAYCRKQHKFPRDRETGKFLRMFECDVMRCRLCYAPYHEGECDPD
jgi:hypothetical protein